MRRPSRRQLWIGGAVLALVLLIVLAMRPEAIETELFTVARGPLQVTIDEDGMTRMRRHAAIAAPVNGRLQESSIDPGDTVSRGQVVARITAAPLDPRARDQAQAALEQARALVREAAARVEQARVASTEAQRARERAEQLAEVGAIADRELEAAIAEERVRARDLEAAEARHRAAMEQERAARTALTIADPAASPGVVMAVRSPIAGRVLRVHEENERVVPAGTPLVEVGDPTSLEVVVDVLSSDAIEVRAGQDAVVQVPQGRSFTGRVTRVEPAAFVKVSPLGVEERRVNVIVALHDSATGLGHQFEVNISIVLWEGENVLQVPATSLVPVDTAWAVYVIEDDRARLRPVTVGHRGTRSVEITDGLNEGEWIVRHPDERIADGARVVRTRR